MSLTDDFRDGFIEALKFVTKDDTRIVAVYDYVDLHGELVAHLSDDDITKLRRGGHDYRKVFAAYDVATRASGKPTAILAKTVKGWTLGTGVEARNITHQAKKLTEQELKIFRDRLELVDWVSPLQPLEHPRFFLDGRVAQAEPHQEAVELVPMHRKIPLPLKLPGVLAIDPNSHQVRHHLREPVIVIPLHPHHLHLPLGIGKFADVGEKLPVVFLQPSEV